MGAAVALLALLIAGRIAYPSVLDRRARRRHPLAADGTIAGAGTITLEREGAPAVLLLHGGGDTPQVLAGLAAHLHASGYAVRVPLLDAHGRSLAEFARATSDAWFAQVRREYERSRHAHPAVYVVGLSMGGALAITLAAEHPDMPALVLLAPYIDMSSTLRRVARSSRYWGWLAPYVPSLGRRSIHDRAAAARGLGHGLMTPAALRALHDVMRKASESLPSVRVPTLIVQSREDNRVPVASAQRAFDRLGAETKELVWLDGAGHVITVDYGHEHVFALVLEWLRSHENNESPAHRTGLSEPAGQA